MTVHLTRDPVNETVLAGILLEKKSVLAGILLEKETVLAGTFLEREIALSRILEMKQFWYLT